MIFGAFNSINHRSVRRRTTYKSSSVTERKDYHNQRYVSADVKEVIKDLDENTMQHYSGMLGDFDYDPKMFYIEETNDREHIRFKQSYEGGISFPKGCIDASNMFEGANLSNCCLYNFDTSGVENMKRMFKDAVLPQTLSFDDDYGHVEFDTSSVKNMNSMFENCRLPQRFSFGDKFDTSNVESMCGMFRRTYIPDSFSLGDKFDTSNVKDMRLMFYESNISKDFSLGDKFDTHNVEYMGFIFYGNDFSKSFTLGDKFDISNVKNASDRNNIFTGCSRGGRGVSSVEDFRNQSLYAKLKSMTDKDNEISSVSKELGE